MGRTMFNSDYMSPKQIERMKEDSQPPLCEVCDEPYLFEEMLDGICLECLEVDDDGREEEEEKGEPVLSFFKSETT